MTSIEFSGDLIKDYASCSKVHEHDVIHPHMRQIHSSANAQVRDGTSTILIDKSNLYARGFDIDLRLIGTLNTCLNHQSVSTITCLNFWRCRLSVEAVTMLAAIVNQGLIEQLHIDDNISPLDGADCFRDMMRGESSRLQYLSLRSNSISDQLSQSILQSLEGNQNLTGLNLWNNRIGPLGAVALADALRLNKTLTSISLAKNHIGDNGVIAIVNALEEHQLSQKERDIYSAKDALKKGESKLLTQGLGKAISKKALDVKDSTPKLQADKRSAAEKSAVKKSTQNLSKQAPATATKKVVVTSKSTEEESALNPSSSHFELDGISYSRGNSTLVYLDLSYNRISSKSSAILKKLVAKKKASGGVVQILIEGNEI
eukprot:Partr_v1_DN28654_c0_g1_i2_m49722 putative Leucine rich repeat containing 71